MDISSNSSSSVCSSAPRTAGTRRGVIVPLFAITLPALLLLCCIALNVAQFRMLRTELKIAADASAHAGSRAMSFYQDVNQTIQFAQEIGRMNSVGNKPFELDDSQVVFGRSTRASDTSRYSFTPYSTESVQNNTLIPNSIGIRASGPYPVLMAAISGRNTIQLEEKSVATQVDRDVILVLDKSGSMLQYKDDSALNAVLLSRYQAGTITQAEYNDAESNNVFSANVVNELSGDMKTYAEDRCASSTAAPRFSRYAQLKLGVDAFFDVVGQTDQIEYVGLVMFSSGATLENTLTSNYTSIKNTVNGTNPAGSTAIGQGMQAGVPELFTSSRARPFASKTIVVLTDGINNVAPDPVATAQAIKNANNVTIHTVTLSKGADPTAMASVAQIGGGKHYHSDTGDNLVPIFREIANNLPTLLTQ